MIKRTIGIICAAALLTGGVSLAQQTQPTGKTINLTLDDCISRALKNNLNVAILELSPELAEYSLRQANEKFIPTLQFSFTDSQTRNASYSWLDTTTDAVFTGTGSINTQIRQEVPTGGTFTVALSGTRQNSNQRGRTINPSYNTNLSFSLTQPLLRDFGPTMSRRLIIQGQYNLEKAGYDFRANVANQVLTVEQAYWNLVYTIENLKVSRQSLKLAQDLLDKNKLAVEIGTMAPRDILSAQTSVAQNEANIIAAEASVKDAEDNLRGILNLVGDEKSAGAVVPIDKPNIDIKPVDLDQSILIAMQNRPELKSLNLDLENQKLNLRYTRNQLLPSLSLTAGYQSPGVSGDRLVFENNDALKGQIIGIIPGGVSQALKDSLKFMYNNWNIGLTLSIPLSNILSRASMATAVVNMRQVELNLKNREQQIYLEITTAVRSVETNTKKLQALKIAGELADQTLKAEEEKLRVGLSTPYQVLLFQRDLSNARIQELNALIGLNNAQAKLEQVLGTSLEKKGIKIEALLNKN